MSGNVSKDSEKGKAAESVDNKDAAELKTEVKVAEPELTVEDGKRHLPLPACVSCLYRKIEGWLTL